MLDTTIARATVAALLFGTLYRLFPAVIGAPWLPEFFITEDGYLMLTVARNIAIGNGLSVSAGEIPTNGVQPLATFLFALPYAFTDGDKLAGLAGIVLISTAVALAGFFAVRAFARQVMAGQGVAAPWPMVAAALWFIGPLLLLHTMNALETGLYTLMLLLALLYYIRILALGAGAGRAETLLMGVLCGVVFLARNDGAVFATSVFGTWFLHRLVVVRAGLRSALTEVVPAGLASLVVAAPWLVNNVVNFGSIIPISGTAQSFEADFAANAPWMPAKLFEHMFPMLPIPGGVELNPVVMAVCAGVVVVVLGVFWVAVCRRGGPVAWAVTAYLLHGIGLVAYYGLAFGAAHFASRYMAPLAPLLIVAGLVVLLLLARHVPKGEMLAGGAALGGLALSVLLLMRLLLPGVHTHEHFQVVRWINANTTPETWVGAVQTGTLGYWHDRTINLDGKVNPEALRARMTEGNVLAYVVGSRIDYVADWNGMVGWAQRTEGGFADAFELVVDDPAANLAVLRRRSPRGG